MAPGDVTSRWIVCLSSTRDRFTLWEAGDRAWALIITLHPLLPDIDGGLLGLDIQVLTCSLWRGRQGGDSHAQTAGEKSKKPGALSNSLDSSAVSITKPQHSAPLARGKSIHRGNGHHALGQARFHIGHPEDQRKGQTGPALEKVLGLWMVGHGDTYL